MTPPALALALLPAVLSGGTSADELAPAKGGSRIACAIGPFLQVGLTVRDGKGKDWVITARPDGKPCNTVVKIDGKVYLLGSRIGEVVTRAEPLGKAVPGYRSVWRLDKVSFTQTVELVASAGGTPDTAVVRYLVENRDDRPHQVGLRVMVDTKLGATDGHPFRIPGKPLITKQADLRGADVPEVLEAPEREQDPPFTAFFTLRPGGGLRPPDRLLITHWPGGWFYRWELPRKDFGTDGAVGLYWEPEDVPAGGARSLGYAFGAGPVRLGSPRGD
jgi:hypothetical protein